LKSSFTSSFFSTVDLLTGPSAALIEIEKNGRKPIAMTVQLPSSRKNPFIVGDPAFDPLATELSATTTSSSSAVTGGKTAMSSSIVSAGSKPPIIVNDRRGGRQIDQQPEVTGV